MYPFFVAVSSGPSSYLLHLMLSASHTGKMEEVIPVYSLHTLMMLEISTIASMESSHFQKDPALVIPNTEVFLCFLVHPLT